MIDRDRLLELANGTVHMDEGEFAPVTMAGMYDIQQRCPDVGAVDIEDTSTWGDVNWLSYRAIDEQLYVLKHSYEAGRTA